MWVRKKEWDTLKEKVAALEEEGKHGSEHQIFTFRTKPVYDGTADAGNGSVLQSKFRI